MYPTPVGNLRTEVLEMPLKLRRIYLSEKFLLNAKFKNPAVIEKINMLNQFDLTKFFWQKIYSPPLCEGFRIIET